MTSTAVAQEMLSYVKANVFQRLSTRRLRSRGSAGGWGGWLAGRLAGWRLLCSECSLMGTLKLTWGSESGPV